MLGHVLISGSIGAAVTVVLSYGISSFPCGLANTGADVVCHARTFGKVLDNWKFGFIVGGLVGLVGFSRHQKIPRLQPVHLSATSLIILGIHLAGTESNAYETTSNNLSFGLSNNSSQYSPQMQAFLATIRWAETGTSGSQSYRKLVFKGNFDNFSTHPLIKQCAPINGRRVCSTAAGAYQMLDESWYDLQPKLQLEDFSPRSQDKMAIEYIRRNGALSDIEVGNFDTAACKVGRVWASLICNDYSQNPKTLEQLRKHYQQELLAKRK